MNSLRRIWLLLIALVEIACYELIVWRRGFGPILSRLRRQSICERPAKPETEQAICNAVHLATCFYWKPVLCLQRAVCTVKLLRRYGIVARLMIGYRPSPFFSHAWVEVEGRVVYGSSAYKTRLRMLHTV